VANATLPADCNGELEFIVVVAKRLESYPKRSNFGSNGAARFSTCLHIDIGHEFKSELHFYAGAGAQGGLHKLIM
jgi:hypothetical protein